MIEQSKTEDYNHLMLRKQKDPSICRPIRRVRESPDCVKMFLDVRTPLEAVGVAMMGASAMLLIYVADPFVLFQLPGLRIFSLKAAIFLLIAGLIWYKMVDEYYVLDFERQALFLHSEFFFSITEKVVAQPFEMSCVAVEGLRSNDGGGWFYAPILILNNGEAILLTDKKYPEYDLDKLNKKAQRIAGNFNIPFHQSPGKKFVAPFERGNDKLGIKFDDHRYFRFINYYNLIVVGLMIVFILLIRFFYGIDFNNLFS